MSSSRALSRRLSRPIFVATIVAVFTMVTVGSAEASIVDDLRAILQRAQQVAAQPPAPPVTGGIAGQIGPATGTTPPPSQIGYIYFSNTTSDGSGTEAQQRAFPKLGSNHCALPVGPGAAANHDYVLPTFGCKNDEIRYMGVNLKQLFPVEPNHPAGYGGMDVTDYRFGITVSLWDSSTCGATNPLLGDQTRWRRELLQRQRPALRARHRAHLRSRAPSGHARWGQGPARRQDLVRPHRAEPPPVLMPVIGEVARRPCQ